MPLSRTEMLRVLRAFYRRQILSNTWGATFSPRPERNENVMISISNPSDHDDLLLGLFGSFESWEMQHIEHADLFITRLCSALLHHSHLDAAAQPIDKAEFGELVSRQDRLVEYMQTHPGLADTVLGKLAALGLPGGDQDSTPGQGHDAVYGEYLYPYELANLGATWQETRAVDFPDPVRDKLHRDGAAIEFVTEDVNLVPFGWVDALDGRYANRFGEALVNLPRDGPDNTSTERARLQTSFLWRCTGFALWDRPRVEALKKQDWLGMARTGWVRGRGDGADALLLDEGGDE